MEGKGEENRKYKELAKNTVFFAIGSFGTKILSFLLVPLYTNVLSTSDYGLSEIVTTTVGLLIYILTLNVGDAVLRFVIEKKEKKNEILSLAIRTVLLGSSILGIGLLIVYRFGFFSIPDYCYIFIFLGFISNSIYSIENYYLQGIKKVSLAVVGGIIQSAVMIVVNIVTLLVFKIGVIGFLLGSVSGSIAASLFYYIYIVFVEHTKIAFFNTDKTLYHEMLIYSMPLVVNGISWWINSGLDKYFVTWYHGAGENGIYSIASKIPTILSTVVTIFLQSWGLSVIREYNKNDDDGFFSNVFNLFTTIVILMGSFLVLLNIPIARILFSKEFYSAWNYSSILLLSSILSLLAGFVGNVFSAVKKTKVLALSSVFAAITNTILNAVLIPSYGSMGASIATVIAFAFVFVFRFVVSRKYLQWKVYYWKNGISFCLFFVQIVAEHFENHSYALQSIIIVLLLIINWKDICYCFRVIISRIKVGKGKEK